MWKLDFSEEYTDQNSGIWGNGISQNIKSFFETYKVK